jgi:hypothetical protein
MTLTIEDGTGVPGADSFNTVAECSAHAVAYFGQALTGNNPDKEAALRRAWVYMAALQWQADLWPTFGGIIPEPVKIAQSVLARAEFQAAGSLSPSVTVSGKKVLNKVGSLGWDVQSGQNTVEAARPVVTMAMDLLGPYLSVNPAQSGSRTYMAARA